MLRLLLSSSGKLFDLCLHDAFVFFPLTTNQQLSSCTEATCRGSSRALPSFPAKSLDSKFPGSVCHFGSFRLLAFLSRLFRNCITSPVGLEIEQPAPLIGLQHPAPSQWRTSASNSLMSKKEQRLV